MLRGRLARLAEAIVDSAAMIAILSSQDYARDYGEAQARNSRGRQLDAFIRRASIGIEPVLFKGRDFAKTDLIAARQVMRRRRSRRADHPQRLLPLLR